MSTYIEDNEISAINREAAEKPVVVSDELFTLILRSLDISVLTRGAFDITYDSIGRHYDFREGLRPDEGTISEELPRDTQSSVASTFSGNSALPMPG